MHARTRAKAPRSRFPCSTPWRSGWRCRSSNTRAARRAETDARVAAVFGATDEAALTRKLAENDIAFARVNDTSDLAVHPQLRRIEIGTPSGVVSYPAPPARMDAAPPRYGAVPALGEHTAKIR